MTVPETCLSKTAKKMQNSVVDITQHSLAPFRSGGRRVLRGTDVNIETVSATIVCESLYRVTLRLLSVTAMDSVQVHDKCSLSTLEWGCRLYSKFL